MSQRETKVASVPFNFIGGINQRVRITELKPEEYANLQGTFPEFTGLQSRLWGKRLLKKYVDSIYGIYQFWSPYGYGAGLYQFTGTLDAGPWIAPISNFDFLNKANDTIPDLIPGDLTLPSLITIDENGFSFGPLGQDSFNSTIFTPLGTPDDTNGGPAGQGKSCQIVVVHSDLNIIDFEVSEQTANLSQITPLSNTDNCRNPVDGFNPPCVAYPPLPVPLNPPPANGPFGLVVTTGNFNASVESNTVAIFTTPTNGICDFRTVCNQGDILSDTKMILNFASLQNPNQTIEKITLLATLTPGGATEIAIPIGNTELESGFNDVPLQASNLLPSASQTLNGDNGHHKISSIAASQIRVYVRKRVCS